MVVVVGPTAVGKTATAIFLAQHFATEILSADSRQFYREMSIGTAKPDAAELQAAVHHFVNSHSIAEEYSAGDYERDALQLLDRLFEKKDVVVAVGGSGLFIRALTEGLDDLPKAPEGVRERLNAQHEREGLALLKQRLLEVDPDYYEVADIDNPQRVIRALEVYEATGNPISYYQKNKVNERFFDVVTVGLNMERSQLYERINRRVDKMMEAGLEDEVKFLSSYRNQPALLTVGYAEMFDYFDGEISLEEAIEKIKQNSRRYAKRQITWFKKYGNTTWFEPGQLDSIVKFVESRL
nr:tRNA (adenosine(37)-N6)-dimethylallyltransferase MiaA [Sphingobacterium faecale]